MTAINSIAEPLGDIGKLPAEVRKEIYKYALTIEQPIELSRRRLKNPDYDPERDRTVFPWAREPKSLFHCKCIVRSKTGKKVLRKPASHHPSLNLLRTSSVIQAEAAPILYGANEFDFKNSEAITTFADAVGANFALVTHLVVRIDFRSVFTKDFEHLNRLANAKSMRVDVGLPYHWTATDVAQRVWYSIKPYVTTHEVIDDESRQNMLVNLPEKVQYMRAFNIDFEPAERIKFEATVAGVVQHKPIEDRSERRHRFNSIMQTVMHQRVQEVEVVARRKQRVIDKQMHKAETLKVPSSLLQMLQKPEESSASERN